MTYKERYTLKEILVAAVKNLKVVHVQDSDTKIYTLDDIFRFALRRLVFSQIICHYVQLVKEKAREKQLREEMEKELSEKDKQLQELLNKHNEMEDHLSSLNTQEVETKQENEKLQKEKDDLEELLQSSSCHLDDSRSYIEQMRKQHRDEKRDKAMAALQISEGIALERESLVKQLDMLRDMNKKLRDDKDEAELRRAMMNGERANSLYNGDQGDGEANMESSASTKRGVYDRRQQLSKQGSILSDYFGGRSSRSFHGDSLEDDIECDDDIEMFHPLQNNLNGVDENGGDITVVQHNNLNASRHGSRDDNENVMDPASQRRKKRMDPDSRYKRPGLEDQIIASESVGSNYSSSQQRGQPVGANDVSQTNDSMATVDVRNATPERLFKVVFVGDSGVGKSSFIHRFCSNSFKATFSATIGVDFQVKNLRVDGHVIALQLWDTAGQERFRSITKQYFRKADGVLVMYDVTSEASYMNVRNWMTSVNDGTEDGTVLCLVGNKTDLCEDDEHRVVKTKDGVKLADEYGALFYECSAMSGVNVSESLDAMASLLREREDRQMEKALTLNTNIEKEKGCCK